MAEEIVSVSEAAAILGLSREAVYSAIREGRLTSVQVLGRIGVGRSALEGYQPNESKVRAGKERATTHRLMELRYPSKSDRQPSYLVLDTRDIWKATRPQKGGPRPSRPAALTVAYADGEQEKFTGAEAEEIFAILSQKPGFVEVTYEHGVMLLNTDQIRRLEYRETTPQGDPAVLKVKPGKGGAEVVFFGDTAETALRAIKESRALSD
ncbi:MAG: hypothetical protein QOH25_1798 [Acidobacteriota bacterium]|jgi:excisionase family DNA binding protein|nr:hypothetical protein [Acidobacteriota bacterium]